MPEKEGRISLPAVLDDLGRRGITDLLVEGGPTVHRSFLREKLADQIMTYIAPVLIGDQPGLPEMNLSGNLEILADVQIRSLDDDVLIEGYLE